jgi:dUTP diphosphatase
MSSSPVSDYVLETRYKYSEYPSKIRKIRKTTLLILPDDDVIEFYQNHGTYHEGDAGIDLFSPVDMIINANSYGNKVGLNIQCEMRTYPKFTSPESYYVERPLSYRLALRSSTAMRTPLRLSNSEGIIDAGYRGEICAIFDNPTDTDFKIERGSRLVQIVGPKLQGLHLRIVKTLSLTTRGTGGLGSTGQ